MSLKQMFFRTERIVRGLRNRVPATSAVLNAVHGGIWLGLLSEQQLAPVLMSQVPRPFNSTSVLRAASVFYPLQLPTTFQREYTKPPAYNNIATLTLPGPNKYALHFTGRVQKK